MSHRALGPQFENIRFETTDPWLGRRALLAHLDEGPGLFGKRREDTIGSMEWSHDPESPAHGTITDIGVAPEYRRQGLGSEMLRRARVVEPNLKHNPIRSDAGEAWARATGDRLPERQLPKGRQ